MAIICQETATISGSNSVICGKLIHIADIRPTSSTIDIFIEGQITPQVGDNTFTIGNEEFRLQLVSKNVIAGTAIVTLTISGDGTTGTTHHLDIYIKPHTWYSQGGAVDGLTNALTDITGAIVNAMTSLGLSEWEYVSTEILPDPNSSKVIVRINLNDLTLLSPSYHTQAFVIPAIPLVTAVSVVVILVGVVVSYHLNKGLNLLLGEIFTGKQIGDNHADIIERGKQSCAQRFVGNPVGYADCVAANTVAVTGASGDFFKDPKITQAGTDAASKIDSCIAEYDAGLRTEVQLKACSNSAADDAKGTIITQTEGLGGLDIGTYLTIVATLGLTYYILTRHPEKVKAGYSTAKREYMTAKSAYRTLRS